MSALSVALAIAAHGLAPGGVDALVDGAGALRGAIVTYGIVTFDDDGVPRWVCEEAMSEGGVPRGGVVTDDGTLVVVGPREGLFVSRDHGCSWESVPSLADTLVADVVRDAADRVVFATRDPRRDAVIGVVDTATLDVVELARIPAVVVEALASDGARVAAALTEVGAGTTRLVVVREAALVEVNTGGADAWPLSVDDTGTLLVAVVENDGVDIVALDDGDAIADAPLWHLDERPRALVRDGGRIVATTSAGVLTSSDGASATTLALDEPGCVAVSSPGALACGGPRDHELVRVDEGLKGVFETADVRPRACPEGTRAAEECPAIWALIHETQGIGRALDPLVDETPRGCASGATSARPPASALALALLAVVTRSRRRP